MSGSIEQRPTPRAPVAHPRGHRAGAAHGRPRRDDRDHRAAVGPGRPRLRSGLAPMGDDGLRAGVRLPAPAWRKDQRPDRAQVDVHRRAGRIRGRLGRGGSRFVVRGLGGGARGAGRLRRAPGTRGALHRRDHVHRSRRARQGVRDLRRYRERRGRRRAPARRVPHRAPDLALDHVPEPGLRDPRGHRGRATAREHAPGRAPPHRRTGGAGRNLGPLRLGLRVLQRRAGRLERSAHHRPARVRGRRRRGVRRNRAAGGRAAPAAAGGRRPQPGCGLSGRLASRASRRSRRSCS